MSWDKWVTQGNTGRSASKAACAAKQEVLGPAASDMHLPKPATLALLEIEAVRWEKVLALRAAIEAGSYQVSSLELATCLLQKSERQRGKASMYSA